MDQPVLSALPEGANSVLCVAAHPDDLEYGVSAYAARLSASGVRVGYYLLSRGESSIESLPPHRAFIVREEESRRAAERVGVDDVQFGDHSDGVIEYGPALRRDIAREIRRWRPDLVITGDYRERFYGGLFNHPDHRAVGLAALDAATDAGNRWVFPELAAEGLEPWSGVRWIAFAGPLRPTHYADVTGHLDAAVSSLEAHVSYYAALPAEVPSPRALMTSLLSASGQRCGVEHAVLFDLVSRA